MNLSVISAYAHRLWKVDFDGDSDEPGPETVRVETEVESEANAVSSEVSGFSYDPFGPPGLPPVVGTHTIAIDVDFPAVLVPSSTSGHHHLYVDIPPVTWEAYERWLIASVEIGLIEEGYLRASQGRKATFLRLPWVKKTEGEQK